LVGQIRLKLINQMIQLLFKFTCPIRFQFHCSTSEKYFILIYKKLIQNDLRMGQALYGNFGQQSRLIFLRIVTGELFLFSSFSTLFTPIIELI